MISQLEVLWVKASTSVLVQTRLQVHDVHININYCWIRNASGTGEELTATAEAYSSLTLLPFKDTNVLDPTLVLCLRSEVRVRI
jgi:hypothetical protein